MRLLRYCVWAFLPWQAFATENLCRAADLIVNFPRSLLLGKLDSARSSDSELNEDFTYDSNGHFIRRLANQFTLEYQRSGFFLRLQPKGTKEYSLTYLNADLYPDSMIAFDSLGQSVWREVYRYGQNFAVVHDTEYDEIDSVHFTATGMQYFAYPGFLAQSCETVADHCTCHDEAGGAFSIGIVTI